MSPSKAKVPATKEKVEKVVESEKEKKASSEIFLGASEDMRKKMVFIPNKKTGVWGNEDSFQNALNSYVKFIGSHPVFSHLAVKKNLPIKEGGENGRATVRFGTKFWWPHKRTTLSQYCNCHLKSHSANYLGAKVRRTHCQECGFYVDPKSKAAALEYIDATPLRLAQLKLG